MVLLILAIFSGIYVVKSVYLIFDSQYLYILCSVFLRENLSFTCQIVFDIIPTSVILYQHYQKKKEIDKQSELDKSNRNKKPII